MRLIHPIYLDVPMLVSFAAALQGGVAFGSEITQERVDSDSKETAVSGKLGLSNIFSQLFDASVEAETAQSQQGSEKEIKIESKSHTEASIAIVLYNHLKSAESGLICPETTDEFKELQPGDLVELAGTLEKNAVDATIDYIDAVSILGNLEYSKSKQKQKDLEKQMGHYRDKLESDRGRTPISNVLMHCSEPIDMEAVLTLRTENLRDLTLSELHKNDMRVVGKVTRVIEDGQSMKTFENYGLAMIESGELRKNFKHLTSTKGVSFDLSDVEIVGPAVQLLPLMVFV